MTTLSMRLAFLLLPAFALTAAEGPATFKVSEFNFKRPASWEWVETTSTMRKAQLKVPDPKKSAGAEVVFFHFGEGNAGGTQANVDRWYGQFQEPRDQIKAKSESVSAGKHKVTYVEAHGTYLSGPPGGAKTSMPNHMLLGAIIEADGGSVFIKFTGSADLAGASRKDFRQMIESALK